MEALSASPPTAAASGRSIRRAAGRPTAFWGTATSTTTSSSMESTSSARRPYCLPRTPTPTTTPSAISPGPRTPSTFPTSPPSPRSWEEGHDRATRPRSGDAPARSLLERQAPERHAGAGHQLVHRRLADGDSGADDDPAVVGGLCYVDL